MAKGCSNKVGIIDVIMMDDAMTIKHGVVTSLSTGRVTVVTSTDAAADGRAVAGMLSDEAVADVKLHLGHMATHMLEVGRNNTGEMDIHAHLLIYYVCARPAMYQEQDAVNNGGFFFSVR